MTNQSSKKLVVPHVILARFHVRHTHAQTESCLFPHMIEWHGRCSLVIRPASCVILKSREVLQRIIKTSSQAISQLQ
jgi:hypothetical protein